MRLLLLLPRATTIVSPAVGRRRRRRRDHHRAATHTLCGAFSSKQQQQQRESDVNNRPTLSSKDVSRRLGKLKRDCVENKTRETAPTSEVIGKRFSEVCFLVLFVLSLFLKTCFVFVRERCAEEIYTRVISLKHTTNIFSLSF